MLKIHSDNKNLKQESQNTGKTTAITTQRSIEGPAN